MKVGDRVSVNKVNAKLNPNQLKILNTMLKRGGDGKVEIIDLDRDYAKVAGWSGDALLGTLRVPASSLKESKLTKSQEFLSISESELSKDEVKEALAKVMQSVVRDLNDLCNKYLNSGGVDLESFDNAVSCAKVLLKAALIDEADAFMIPDKHKKDVRNLNRM